jgi:hypothetical protein
MEDPDEDWLEAELQRQLDALETPTGEEEPYHAFPTFENEGLEVDVSRSLYSDNSGSDLSGQVREEPKKRGFSSQDLPEEGDTPLTHLAALLRQREEKLNDFQSTLKALLVNELATEHASNDCKHGAHAILASGSSQYATTELTPEAAVVHSETCITAGFAGLSSIRGEGPRSRGTQLLTNELDDRPENASFHRKRCVEAARLDVETMSATCSPIQRQNNAAPTAYHFVHSRDARNSAGLPDLTQPDTPMLNAPGGNNDETPIGKEQEDLNVSQARVVQNVPQSGGKIGAGNGWLSASRHAAEEEMVHHSALGQADLELHSNLGPQGEANGGVLMNERDLRSEVSSSIRLCFLTLVLSPQIMLVKFSLG